MIILYDKNSFNIVNDDNYEKYDCFNMKKKL